jgi:hypothetical protein
MSYEGYVQHLCKNGHARNSDAYDSFEKEEYKCDACGAGLAWENHVDVTNGSFDMDGTRIDGFVELEVDKPAEVCTCDKCKNSHIIKEATYKIPPPKVYKEELDEPDDALGVMFGE